MKHAIGAALLSVFVWLPALALAQAPSAVDANGASQRALTAPGITINGPSTVNGKLAVATISAPTASTFSTCTGTLTTATYYYRVSATNAAGETTAFTEASKAITGPLGVKVIWGQVTGASGYKVYGRSTGAELLIATITGGTTLSYCDAGSVTPSGALPSRNATADSTMAGNLAVTGTISGPVSVTNLDVSGNTTIGDATSDTLLIAPTTVGLTKENAHTVAIATSTTTNTAGGALTVAAGTASGNATGGNLILNAGSTTSGTAGSVVIGTVGAGVTITPATTITGGLTTSGGISNTGDVASTATVTTPAVRSASAGNVALAIDAAGSGTITLGGTSTGGISASRAVTANAGVVIPSGQSLASNAATNAAGITSTGIISAGGTTVLADANVPFQINSTGQMWYGANKSGAYGLLMGYSAGSFGSVTGAVLRQIPTDPFYIFVNSTTKALTIDSAAAATFEGAMTTKAGIANTGDVASTLTVTTPSLRSASAGNVALAINAAGSGTIAIGGTSTGQVSVPGTNGLAVTNAVTAASYATADKSQAFGAWNAHAIGLTANGSIFDGPFWASSAWTVRQVACSSNVAGVGGTTGYVLRVRNVTDSSTLCTLTATACNTGAHSTFHTDCNANALAGKHYRVEVDSSSDCATYPTDTICNVQMSQ